MASTLDMLDNLDGLDGFDTFDPFDPLEPQGFAQDPLEEDQFLGGIIRSIGGALGGLFGGEGEYELPGLQGFSPDQLDESVFHETSALPESQQAAVMMDLLVDQLAESESEGENEADQFIPILASLAPLAMKAIPAIAKAAAPIAKKVLPHLGRGIVNMGRQIMRSPHTRQLVRGLPSVARNTAADVLRTYSRTGQINGDMVRRSLARNAASILRVRRNRARALRRNRAICNRFFPGMIRSI